ncbi:Rpn family recombination-promoting nuclease/putative transposase [Paenibacillus thiaminolyticus]|uniref:Rpn family recombination-promoting nuclease/putative transposase n=1 Tax=Paenibacillus thiaminolyticus TaxID=49283 RepID=A0ABT4FTI8_PANTH|nr:Rpn family recombination-promoting nuclease/putative transposase [Paenibacillus thiaminolyticus]MCY9537463.1 Rpn family recombination-promoting nuclease/putative transposase [Paenibacillus thiaminolyticus]MCY9601150.1 Rpn family recombination-promoting nuclease/putative transposase [Paenibacillus thiaminolyticus]MCY9607472.1 Rpn family recombination-promoting nuclease/putative transposase [Paenibacillus thiaminolyticus]MCY9613131.1 Rpn family recombination-promoting nuclease/putative transpo
MISANIQQTERLNPKNDFLFKRLFGEEEGKKLLISLLNAILKREGARQITDVAILEDTKLARELVEDKEAVLDILCEIDGREKVNVEMQVRRFVRMDYRSLFYVGKLLTESLHYGEPYDRMQRSIGINILDHYYLPLEKYHSTFHLYEDDDRHYMLTDILEIHFIECPKFRQLPFDLHDPLHRWLRFLEQKATAEQLEELMMLDKVFKEAEDRLARLASDAETRRRYALREKALHDRASLLQDARTAGFQEGIEQGIERGIEQGFEQGIYQTALNMLREGLETTFISRITGLDGAQLERVRETMLLEPKSNGTSVN